MDIAQRPQLEADLARRLSLASSKRRHEFVALLGEPAAAANVPDSFWQNVEREFEEDLMLGLLLILAASSEAHGFESGSDALAPLAAGRAKEVAQGYVAHSREAALQAFPPAGGDGATTIPRTEITGRALDIFGPVRDERIAVNEVTWGITRGGEFAKLQTVGLSEDDTWHTEQDDKVCSICSPLHETPRSNWKRFFSDGPPAHPFCRCWIQYVGEVISLELQNA